jgi:uncharacterized protein (TIGR04255 family)
VQIQHDRLLLNWRKAKPNDPYPRYVVLREEYSRLWSEFAKYVESFDLGVLQPITAEVTFFNRIDSSGLSVVSEVISAINPHWSIDGQTGTSMQIQRTIGDPTGRPLGSQNIALGHMVDSGFIQMEVSSQVGLNAQSTTTEAVLAALDAAHDAGVLTFDHITTDGAHAAWGKHDA